VHMKIYFLWLGVFYDNVMLFVVFLLSPLKAMVCNLDLNLLLCDCECVLFI
jgi:hypothetical protein